MHETRFDRSLPGGFADELERLSTVCDDPAQDAARLLMRGVIYRRAGAFERALASFREALATGHHQGRAHAEIARLEESRGHAGEAVAAYRRALAAGFIHVDVHKDMGRAALRHGDTAEACAQLTAAIACTPQDASLFFDRARALAASGDRAAAGADLQRALALLPADDAFMRNLVLNEHETLTGATCLRSLPRCLWLTVTTRCNIRCIMCNVWERSWDLPARLVPEVMALLPSLEAIRWQGGEVFLWPPFRDLFAAAVGYGRIKQNINTNGLLIDDAWARLLCSPNVSLTFAVDGVTAPTYERIRRGGSFAVLKENIERVHQYKKACNASLPYDRRMTTTFSFIVMRSNWQELEKTVDFARHYDFDCVQIYPIDGSLDAENIFIHDDHAALEGIRAAMKTVTAAAAQAGIELQVKLPPSVMAPPPARPPEEQCRDRAPAPADRRACPSLTGNVCVLPWQHLFIDGSGAIRPSCDCRASGGDVAREGIRAAWNSPLMQEYRASLHAGTVDRFCMPVIDRAAALFETIKKEYAEGHPDALEHLRAFVIHHPDHVPARPFLARALAEHRDYVAAADWFRAALSRDQGDPELWFDLAVCLRRMGDFITARDAFDKARHAGYEPGICLFSAAQSLFDLGRHDEALVMLESVPRTTAAYQDAVLLRACILKIGDRYDAALALLRATCEAYPDAPAVRAEYDRSLAEKDEYERYLRDIVSAERSGATPRHAVTLSAQCAKRGHHDRALRFLAAVKDDEDPEAYLVDMERARHMSALGKHDEALRIMDTIGSRDPVSLPAAQLHATILLRAGAAERARAVLDPFTGPDAGNDMVLLRAQVLLALRDFAGALAAVTPLFDGDADDIACRLIAAQACAGLDRADDAEAHIGRALERYPFDPRLHGFLARMRVPRQEEGTP